MDKDTSKLINIPGELHSIASGNIIAGTDEIFDYNSSLYQSEINKNVGYYIDNTEYVEVHVDASNKILYGVNEYGTFNILSNFNLNGYEYNIIENKEWIRVVIDSQNKILCGLDRKGKFHANIDGIDEQIKPYIDQIKDAVDKIQAFSDIFNVTNDIENRLEITLDSSEKIISYRDHNGILHEDAGISTNKLELTDNGMKEFQKALKDSGFEPGGAGDFSDSKELHIDEPYYAIVNFTDITDIPQSKFLDVKGNMEFYDMNGNYFKKEVIMNAQGRSSLSLPKKNIAIDICNNNGWDDDDTFSLKIGNWVAQDSFHLKSYQADYFRCFCPITYKLYDEIVKTRGYFYDYAWKNGLIDISSITETTIGNTDSETQFDTGAKCFPMGFPCIVYLNGDFYGLYSWQLKKSRENFCMNKKDAKHVHLDGVINDNSLFDANGDPSKINWDCMSTWSLGFEVRNPKSLYLMDGTKYDADTNSGELIDSTSQNYDPTNKDHVRSSKVKGYILNLSRTKSELKNAYDIYMESEKTYQDIMLFKEKFETYFDIKNLSDYLIVSDIVNNWDGFSTNWQWFTYDGCKWYIGIYDADCTFGNEPLLTMKGFREPVTQHIFLESTELATQYPYLYFVEFYKDDIEDRYKSLRDLKIINQDNIIKLFKEWIYSIGKEVYEKEFTKWTGIREHDSLFRVSKWVEKSISNMDTLYNYNQN